jgi:hypothetical protein
MTLLRRLAVFLVTLGSVLAVSACTTTSVPSVVGSYKATFVDHPQPGPMSGFFVGSNSVFALLLDGNGRFVMASSDHARTTVRGTWSESKDVLSLTSPKNQLIALVQGANLRRGRVAYVGRSAPTTYTLTWSAVRT